MQRTVTASPRPSPSIKINPDTVPRWMEGKPNFQSIWYAAFIDYRDTKEKWLSQVACLLPWCWLLSWEICHSQMWHKRWTDLHFLSHVVLGWMRCGCASMTRFSCDPKFIPWCSCYPITSFCLCNLSYWLPFETLPSEEKRKACNFFATGMLSNSKVILCNGLLRKGERISLTC